MGYYVRHLAWKKSAPQWKIQFLSYKKEDHPDSKALKPKKEWDVPKERWRALGFHSSLTLEEARVRARQINAQRYLKRQEERIRKHELDRNQLTLRATAAIPREFAAEFERRFVRHRDSETTNGKRITSQARIVWGAAQKFVLAMQVDPSEWFYALPEIYDYFCQKGLSVRYVHAIIKMANLWGYFISRKLARPFLAIPMPRGYERQRLLEAHYQQPRRVRRPSAPLCPQVLAEASGRMNTPNFNWLTLSVWFGLRPKEVDNLHDPELWSVETLGNGRKILWIFQTKIIALPPEDRWKPIPILFEQQQFALRILESRNFKRPILKTVHKHFGDQVDLYGGRKGFSDLMLSQGHSLENISIWMGHSTLDRTWRSYKSRKRFHLNGY
jgi:hypothetical protein